jgi:hypothetical protein
VGAAEDAAKQPDLVTAKAKMDLAKLAGLEAIRLTAQWFPGIRQLDGQDLLMLQNATGAAALDGIRVFVSIYPAGSSMTPLTQAARDDFVAYTTSVAAQLPTVRDFIIGNEPNLNRFWMPQFDRSSHDVAAPAYEVLLAQTYDALKAVDPTGSRGRVPQERPDAPNHGRVRVPPRTWSPRGSRRPCATRAALPSRSTTTTSSWRFSGRRSPEQRRKARASRSSTTSSACSRGWQRRCSTPTRTRSRPPGRTPFRRPFRPGTTREAIELASCQPTVEALFLFHVSDELDLAAWQSGLYYADETPKSSLAPVKAAAEAAAVRTVVSCNT